MTKWDHERRSPTSPVALGTLEAPAGGLVAETAELVFCDPETAAVLCDAYLFEPDPRERSFGSLALVAETINVQGTPAPPRAGTQRPAGISMSAPHADLTHGVPNSARTVLDAIPGAVRSEYYRDPARDPLLSFEAALGAANAVLARLAEQGVTDWLNNLHLAVIATHGNAVHVARAGHATLLLLRNGQLTDIGEGLADPRVNNPRAVFTNVASGVVIQDDAIVAASPNFFRILPRDRCASLLSGKTPREAVAYTRDLLAETGDVSPVAAVFLRFAKAPIALPPPTPPTTLDRSPRVFVPPAHATIRPPARPSLLRPPFRVRLTRVQRVIGLLRDLATLILWPALQKGARGLLRLGSAALGVVRGATARTTSVVLPHFRQSAPPPLPGGPRDETARRAALPGQVMKNVLTAPDQLRRTFRGWPASTKVFFALTVLLALLFVGSMLLLRRKGIEDSAVRAASEKLQEARVKKDAAEAALIYGNLDQARQMLRETRASVEAVRQTTYYRPESEQLLATLQAVEDRTELIVRVPEPARVGDFGTAAGGRATGLAVVGSDLYATHPETNAIFRLASGDGAVSTVSQTSQGIGRFRAVAALPAEKMLLLATDSPGLALFDAAKGDLLKQELSSLPEGTTEIKSLATFGSRLYLLLPQAKQIFGYSKSLAGYTGGVPWLKDASVPVERASAIGVDGYIYVLLNDGKIVKLLKGSPVEFAQSALTVPLKSPSRLFVNEQLKHLYVLDSPEKRVVVYDTTGKLTRQFVFPNAGDLTEITVGGKEETLYVLDGTSVYRVPLKQAETSS